MSEAREALVAYLEENAKLNRTDASMVSQSLIHSPRLFLEALVEAGYQKDHIVRITEDGYSMIHALQCRLENLFHCDINELFAADEEPPQEPGDYFVWIAKHEREGTRCFKRIEGGAETLAQT